MAHKIDSIKAISKLTPRRDPYWHRVKANHFVGYRYMTKGVTGSWIAKIQDGRKSTTEPLGKLETFAEGEDRFNAALEAAGKWFTERAENGEGTGSLIPSKVTVDQVLNEWRAHKIATAPDSAKDVRNRLQRCVANYLDDKGESWLERPVAKITKAQFANWRAWLNSQTNVGRGENKGKPTSLATINRELATVRAAFNAAHRKYGFAPVWKDAMKRNPKGDGGKRKLAYVDMSDRAKLLDSARKLCPEIAAFMALQLVVPVRPGAAASLLVKDWNKRKNELYIRKDKANAGRTLALPVTVRALLEEASKSKLPDAPLFMNPTGKPWNSFKWSRVMRELLVPDAELDPAVTMYCLRHSRITDLVEQGSDVLTLAELAGTSTKMIQEHYFHLRGDVVRKALEFPGWAQAA